MADLTEFETFSMDSTTLDLVLDAGGSMLGANGSEAIRQECEQAIRPQKGTWPLDLDLGVDWLGFLRGDKDEAALRADIGAQLLSVSGVARIDSITLTRTALDAGTDRLTVEFQLTTSDGVEVGGEVSIP